MIKIIKPGMMVYTAYKFECKTCGCVAEVTKKELWPGTRYFNCPYCGNQHECELITKYNEMELEGYENIEEYPFILGKQNEQKIPGR